MLIKYMEDLKSQKCACATRSSLPSVDFTPKRVVDLRLHDTVARFHEILAPVQQLG